MRSSEKLKPARERAFDACAGHRDLLNLGRCRSCTTIRPSRQVPNRCRFCPCLPRFHCGDPDLSVNGARRRALEFDETSIDSMPSIFIAKIDFDLT